MKIFPNALNVGLTSFAFTRWQMQYTEREHAKQVLKSSFSFIYQYFYRYSGTDTQGSQEFIYLDGLIGFRYQMTVCAETKNHLLSFAE